MNKGLLYQIDDGDDLLTALRRAAMAYVRRTGAQPEVCHAAPGTVAKLAIVSPDLTIVADNTIAPNCLWIGRRI